MAIRAGMTEVVARVRTLAAASADDYDDAALQTVLDRHRQTHKRIEVEPMSDYASGGTTYTEYPLPRWMLFAERDAEASGWALRDAYGNDAPAHSVNYDARMITFDADTGGESYYLDARTYDVYRAAAEVWEEKAAALAGAVDWKSDNHDIKASQEYTHCLDMARKLRARSGPTFTQLVRIDEY